MSAVCRSLATRIPIVHGGTRESSGSHRSDALYQGTTLVGPLRPTKMRALAPEVRLFLTTAVGAGGAMLLQGFTSDDIGKVGGFIQVGSVY
jgi:hypothetical protein